MGLLRKAAGGAPPPPEPGQRGLLRRSIRVLDEMPRRAAGPDAAGIEATHSLDAPESPADSPTVPLVRAVREVRPAARVTAELLGAIDSIPDGVELPSRLFSVIASKLGVRKGALLLYDPARLVYAPWASQGYDTTTLHRLRIPLGANQSFNALANGDPLILSDPGSLGPYQGFFSSREFSTVSRLVLAPFIASDRLVGVLLLSELDPQLPGHADILECLAAVVRSGSARVDTARERRLAAAGTAAVQAPASLEEQASRFVGGAGGPALFMALSLEDYARGVLAGHEHLDPFRLHEDIRYFLGAFVADAGTALAIRQGLFIVGLRDIDPADVDLFLHQLTLYLDGLFGGGGGPAGPRILKKRSWPAEGNDVRSLIDYLAS